VGELIAHGVAFEACDMPGQQSKGIEGNIMAVIQNI
jgi:hypothetical protein